MNILHLEASTGWGGQEMRILKECIEMRNRGHRVFLAVMKGGKLIQKAQELGFIVYTLNFKKTAWIKSFFSLLKILRKHQIDLVNTHSSLDAWLGGIVARFYGCKVVRTRHLSTSIKTGLNSLLLYGYLADFVVTTCEQIVSSIVLQSKKNGALVKSIATGADFSSLKLDTEEAEAFRLKYGIPQNAFLVGTVCVMRSWKGIVDLLKASEILQKKDPSIVVCIIGGGHEETYHEEAKKLGVFGKVIFTGHLESPFSAIQALDCFVLLSTANEGVSQAILQASFFKKPLIATKTGGLKEVCIEGFSGISVDCFNPPQVADAILYLKNNPSVCQFYGNNAHQKVMDCFLLKNTIDAMEKVYETTLQNS